MRVRFTSKARSDRYGQWEYIARFSVAAAERMEGSVRNCVCLLAEHPFIGKQEVESDLRSLTVERTGLVVFYRVENDCVRIVRLLHGAQSWPVRF